jgi:hypothetical protein
MKMIRHEDVGVNLPAGLGAHLGEGFNEALAIRIVPENRLAPGYSTLNLRAMTRE